MRTRRTLGVAVGVLAVTAVLTATALAAGQTNGTGKSHLGFTVGYNAKSDLTGNFEYQPQINGSTVNIHCNDYNRYRQTTTANGLYPKTIFNSTNCYDDVGVRYFAHIEAIDRGEGAQAPQDGLCISVSQYPARLNSVLVKDCGYIQNGNVQIHLDANQNTMTDLLATS